MGQITIFAVEERQLYVWSKLDQMIFEVSTSFMIREEDSKSTNSNNNKKDKLISSKYLQKSQSHLPFYSEGQLAVYIRFLM